MIEYDINHLEQYDKKTLARIMREQVKALPGLSNKQKKQIWEGIENNARLTKEWTENGISFEKGSKMLLKNLEAILKEAKKTQ